MNSKMSLSNLKNVLQYCVVGIVVLWIVSTGNLIFIAQLAVVWMFS